MVIKVKDYEWTQNDEFVIINIPVKGKKKIDVDVIVTENYVKINFIPYLFECFLSHSINEKESKAIISNGIACIQLKKQENLIWTDIHADFLNDKDHCDKVRKEELTRYEETVKNMSNNQSKVKQEDKQYTLREMMDLDGLQRKKIKETKEREAMLAIGDLEQWKEMRLEDVQQELKEMPRVKTVSSNQIESSAKKSTEIFDISSTGDNSTIGDELLLPLRKSCKIEVQFTPRVFPTPERESIKEEEDKWLNSQMEIRKESQIRVTADMKEEEKSPDWLKNKGNSLFGAGDFMAALTAYSMALEINPKLYDLYSNRAACHIKMRNFFKAIEDATKAIELLTPPVQQNLKARIRAHMRRGASYCNLEMYKEGLMDLEKAYKLDPENKSVQADIDKVRKLIC